MFRADQATGKLTRVEIELTGGKAPRNFVVSPNGKFLLAENQASSTVVVFRIDQSTGALSQVGRPWKVPIPVCIRFLEKS